MEQRHELSNGDTFVVTDATRNRLAELGLSEAASSEIIDGMRATVETWAADEPPYETDTTVDTQAS